MEKENCQMHGQDSQELFYWRKRSPEGYTWSGTRLTRKQKSFRPHDVWSDMWKFMFDAAKMKAKQRWAIEKPKLDIARQFWGTLSIEPDHEEFKLTMRAVRRKLEVPMPTIPRREKVGHKLHQDHIIPKRLQSTIHCNCVHKFIPMLQAFKIPDVMVAVEKG